MGTPVRATGRQAGAPSVAARGRPRPRGVADQLRDPSTGEGVQAHLEVRRADPARRPVRPPRVRDGHGGRLRRARPRLVPMIPYTLVLKPGLVIHSIYNGYWFWGRPSTADLWRDLREATKESRPDWDLGTPGLRDAWEAGDWSQFHGWDRRPDEWHPA